MRKNKIAISIFAAVCVVSTIVGYSIIKQNESNNNNQLAVMTEQEDGTYIRSNMSAFGDGDYEFDHAVCNNGSTVTENSNGGVNLRLLGADKCTIYISKAKTVPEKIKKYAQSVEPDFTNGTETGIYTMEDDYGTSYYYRGNITDNYVKFGDYIWRIVRINGDGSLRIIYDGTKPHANGESSNDRALAAPSKFNISNNSAYVGYMYGDINGETYDEVHANTNSSIIKTYLDKWYETNIRDKGLSKYVSDTIFCNDRSVTSGTGVGGTTTDFGAYDRRYTDPILTCPQKNDAFTVDDTENGNGALTYPIGLLTADEYRIASGTSESNTYITKPGITWWLGSPNRIDSGRTPYAYEFCVSTSGNLGDNIVDNTNTVVPVINLTVDYANQLAGTGTMNNPYTFK